MTTTTDPDFRAREALRLIGRDPENWVSDRPGIDYNGDRISAYKSRAGLSWCLLQLSKTT